MRYELLEPSGACIEAFDCRDKAVEIFLGMVSDAPDSAFGIEIIEIDDDLGETFGGIEVERDLFES